MPMTQPDDAVRFRMGIHFVMPDNAAGAQQVDDVQLTACDVARMLLLECHELHPGDIPARFRPTIGDYGSASCDATFNTTSCLIGMQRAGSAAFSRSF